MGFRKEKRPVDLRTKGSTDLKFDVLAGSTSGYVSSVQYRQIGATFSTAASTALSARGVVVLGTSSTSAAANYILTPPAAGEEMKILVDLNGSTFGATVNASTGTAANFGKVAATTDQIRATLPGILGTFLTIVGYSTSRWLVTGHNGVSFSTAAA